MKKIFVALLTFSLGILAFNLWHLDKSSLTQKSTPVQNNHSDKESAIKLVKDNYQEAIEKPFFDSVIEDEYYSGSFKNDDFELREDVWMIKLWYDSEDIKSEKVAWGAQLIRVQDIDSKFSTIWIKTDHNRLSFKTRKVRGIEYRFEGEFLQKGNSFSEGVTVLKGTTQKFVKGRKIKEFTSTFSYFVPECVH
jgi:hypothetical protein